MNTNEEIIKSKFLNQLVPAHLSQLRRWKARLVCVQFKNNQWFLVWPQEAHT